MFCCLPLSSKLANTLVFIRRPTFNYISLCAFPYNFHTDRIIEMVLGKEYNKVQMKAKRNLLEQEIYKLFVSQCKNIRELYWKNAQASTCFSQLCNLNVDDDLVSSNALYMMAQICQEKENLFVENCSGDVPGLIELINLQ